MLGRTPGFVIDQLQLVKTRLNNTRSKLDNIDIKEWKQHTSKTIVTKDVVKAIRNQWEQHDNTDVEGSPEMVTNAWCKMFEILRACQFFNPKDFRTREVRTGQYTYSSIFLKV